MSIRQITKTMRTFLLVLIMAIPLVITAQDQTVTAVTFKGSDGNEMSFLFSEKPTVTFTDDAIVLTTTTSKVELPRTVSYVATFGNSTGGIQTVQKENYYKIDESSIEIHSVSADVVQLYSMSGMLMGIERCDADGFVSIDISNLTKGIYIVKSKAITFKFQKK